MDGQVENGVVFVLYLRLLFVLYVIVASRWNPKPEKYGGWSMMRERNAERGPDMVSRAARRKSEQRRQVNGTTKRASTKDSGAWWAGGRLRLSALAVLTVTIGLLPSASVAQTVHGRLLEQGTGRPITAGDVTLLGEEAEAIDRAETDSTGHFTLHAADPGSFYVRAERIGYRPKTDGVLELSEGGEITIDFYLMPQPIELEGVEGTAEGMTLLERKDREYLEWQGFYDRKKLGFGHFITPEEIEERQPFDMYDVLKRAPFVTGLGGSIRVKSRGGGHCSPKTLVDGARGPLPPVEAIAGIEIYRGIAATPLEYFPNSCGLVLIWTKG